MNIDSIIFDLDGTLWDSTDVVLRAWNIILKNEEKVKELITREDMEGIMGLQIHQIGPKLFPYLEAEHQLRLVKQCCQKEKELLIEEGGVLYSDLEFVLEVLSEKYSLFIVSNCECGYIETFLEYHKLGKYFKDIECAGSTRKSKGENIKLVIKRNDLKSSVYVGDTHGDFEAAKLAEIPFVFANYGFGQVEEYNYCIKNIKEITELVL